MKYNFIFNYNEYLKNVLNLNIYDDKKMFEEFNGVIITEGMIKTHPVDQSIRILKNRFDNITINKEKDGEIRINGLSKDIGHYLPLINNLGYFISLKCIDGEWYNYIDSISGFISGVVIEAKFDLKVEVPPVLYHTTLSKNNKNIYKVGLIPKSNNKKTTHPDRIYFTKDLKIANLFGKELQKDDQSIDISIWEINTNGLVMNLYSDVNMRNYGFYTLRNIPPNNLKLIHV